VPHPPWSFVVVIVLAVGAGLNRPAKDRGGPVDQPTPPARELAYSDIHWTGNG